MIPTMALGRGGGWEPILEALCILAAVVGSFGLVLLMNYCIAKILGDR